jgi:uncharacterized protein (DUF488 family)
MPPLRFGCKRFGVHEIGYGSQRTRDAAGVLAPKIVIVVAFGDVATRLARQHLADRFQERGRVPVLIQQRMPSLVGVNARCAGFKHITKVDEVRDPLQIGKSLE